MPKRQQSTIPADPREWRPQSIHRGRFVPSNGRYMPGGETSDWATVERMPRA